MVSARTGIDLTTMQGPPRGTMTETEMRQQISLAYIHAVASTAGLVIGRWDTDYDGIDLTIRSRAAFDECNGSSLDIQLKCTSQAERQHEDSVSWSLKRDTIEKLTSDPYSLSILALLVVPPNYVDWLHQDHKRMMSMGAMYFSVASNWDPLADDRDSRVIHCPRTNLLTVDKLLELMQLAAKAKVGIF